MHRRTTALAVALCDGVTAHQTLLARCGLWPAYSEYLLYDPIVRIASHLGWQVNCEYKLPKLREVQGDFPRLDFLFRFEEQRLEVALEVKWVRRARQALSLANDIKKLRRVQPAPGNEIDCRFILVAGAHRLGDGGKASLRLRPKDSALKSYVARALGARNRAWGATIFRVT